MSKSNLYSLNRFKRSTSEVALFKDCTAFVLSERTKWGRYFGKVQSLCPRHKTSEQRPHLKEAQFCSKVKIKVLHQRKG